MKLALITPKGVLFGSDPKVADFFKKFLSVTAQNPLMPKFTDWSGGSLGLLIVAALTPPHFEIDFVDENFEEIDFEKGYDLVALTAMTQQATRAYEIADAFRARDVTVAIGGIHATVMPEEAKEHADAVIVGEAEHSWPEFLNDFTARSIKAYYRNTTPVDLTQSPVPRYDLLKKYAYKMIWVQTTRGCPRDCEFCCASKIYGTAYRHKTVDQVLREMDSIRALWNDETLINFADDNMFIDRTYSRALVEKLGSRGLKWTAQSDVSIGEDETFLELLRRSGCIILFIGFETISNKNRLDKHGWKQKKVKNYPAFIRRIQSHGIGILGAFIVGLDEDDISIFDELYHFIIDNRLYAAQITVLTPLPGTALRKRFMREKRILSDDWKRYTLIEVNFIPKKMTAEELQKGVLDLTMKIYRKEARSVIMRHFREIYKKLRCKDDTTLLDGKILRAGSICASSTPTRGS